MKEYSIVTKSRDETHELGEKLGRSAQPGMVFLMNGDLGAGKTTLTQGIGRGLGVKKQITSPTFTIMKIYHGRLTLYHIDAYRMEGIDQDLGFDEYLNDDGLTVIEWSQFMPALIPDEYLSVTITLLDEDQRQFDMNAAGERYERLLEELK
ncbi:MAG: tRNA (adenosine(37)-N6)-threonylcarbamoyltransferase complex ATPase subunit type 1 TsaE [Solobacterium sp.]|nr:tRNA (adenosine(37)-N6)-threonylcarbamoyltransferase complex ATPase subunit type 1 TsaE [Solobacterium sp.]